MLAQDTGTSSSYKSLWAFKKSSIKSLKTTAESLFAGGVDSAVSNDKWTISLEANGVFVHFMLKTSTSANRHKSAKDNDWKKKGEFNGR